MNRLLEHKLELTKNIKFGVLITRITPLGIESFLANILVDIRSFVGVTASMFDGLEEHKNSPDELDSLRKDLEKDARTILDSIINLVKKWDSSNLRVTNCNGLYRLAQDNWV